MGLSDVCPRCGEDFTEIEDEEEQRRHLMECDDEVKHKNFQKMKNEKNEKIQKLETQKGGIINIIIA